MISSASRILLAALGILVTVPLTRADALSDGRAAFASGDFAAAKTHFDNHLANPSNPSLDDARILRAFARLGLAIETEIPEALRSKLGANVAEIDLGGGGLALRFPRPFGYYDKYNGQPIPRFTTVGSFYQYDPPLNLYLDPGNQPSISFENRGAVAYPLTLVVSQPGAPQLDFDCTLYLDGMLLGFVNAFAGYDFEVFPAPLFDIGPDIPKPFDLDLSTPDHYLFPGDTPNSFTVVIPPKSNFTIGLVLSSGDVRFTPSAPLSPNVKVLNGKAGGITQPTLAKGANFAHLVALSATLEDAFLSPAIADLEAISTDANLILSPQETGAVVDTVIAYVDVQILLADLKFLRGLRRLTNSYNFSIPLTPKNLSTDPLELLVKTPAFLTPKPASKALAKDRLLARDLWIEAAAHYANASESGLWTRSNPEFGAYLFGLSGFGDVETYKETFDQLFAKLAESLTGPLLLSDLQIGDVSEGYENVGINLAPLFGSPAVNSRKLIPIRSEHGIVHGGSLALLTSGLLPGFGTANWETFLAKNDLLDPTAPAIPSTAKIQRHPAALTSVREGDPVTLKIVAESYPPPTYKWYRRAGKSEQLVSEGSPVFSLDAAHRDDAGNYFVRVSNTVVPQPPRKPVTTTVTSTTAVLQVTYAPEITAEPSDVTRYQGKSVTLEVTAVGVPKPTYQWFKGETAVTPARTKPKYAFKASAAKAGEYRVVVKNAVGETTSQTITVDVQTKPVFTEHPVSKSVAANGSVVFTAAATGNPAPEIKWRKNGKDIGVTGPTLTLDTVTKADAGTYTAVAFSTVQTSPTKTAAVSTVSKGAKLTVTPAPAP
jgi:Immunoglobulin I-set domain.